MSELLRKFFRNTNKRLSELKFTLKTDNYQRNIENIVQLQNSAQSLNKKLDDNELKEISK